MQWGAIRSVWAVMSNKWSKVKVAQSCPTLFGPRDCSPWNSPGQNTGVCSLCLLQGIVPTQGSNPGLPHCRRILYQLISNVPYHPSFFLLDRCSFQSFSKIPPSQKRYPRKVFEKNQLGWFCSCFYFKELIAHISHIIHISSYIYFIFC